MRILIVFGSFDGQTRRIAQRIAEVIGRAGHEVRSCPVHAGCMGYDLKWAEGVVIGGAIRYGRHERVLEKAVRDYRDLISARPNAFFSVSMSAAGPGAKLATANGYVDQFIARTGWHPSITALFGGALQWSRYNPFIKFMMRIIVGMAGGDTDTSRDHEYTDWTAVERFAAEFELPLREPRAA